MQLDTNDRWFNNPQYRVSVTKKTQLIISLMQEDFKVCGKPLIPVNFLVVRVKSKWNRLWEVDREDVVLNACPGGSSTELRELTRTLWLTPTHDKKPCHYIIVPNTEVDGRMKEEERPFYLRLFASEPLEFYQLPPTLEIPFTNKWGPSTAGGKRVLDNGKENQLWCRNPQYFLNIRKSTHLKIILRKKGGRRIRGVPLGITVTKANGPTVPPATTIIGKGRAGNKVPSSMMTNGLSYAETLKALKKQQNSKEDQIPDFEPPRLDQNLERKLQILPNEWQQETRYLSDDVAALYAFYQPTQGPFIIVPSMAKDDVTADFSLTSK